MAERGGESKEPSKGTEGKGREWTEGEGREGNLCMNILLHVSELLRVRSRVQHAKLIPASNYQ